MAEADNNSAIGLQFTLEQILRAMAEKGATDVHITAGLPPLLRIDGSIHRLSLPPLSPADTKKLCHSVLSEDQTRALEERRELHFSFSVPNVSRFRAGLFMQRGSIAGAFRRIPFKVPSFEELALPEVLIDIARKPRGLVLVTGPAGSGKTTTLASIIDKINSEQRLHILTVEDPIEYLHASRQCVINQREVGSDAKSFHGALMSTLHQDPDVVLVGEMRDLETLHAALMIADTGHLVFAALHTHSAVSSITRIIDAFPQAKQPQIRAQLSSALAAVVSQLLLPKINGGRVPALEVMIPNAAIRSLIRENNVPQIYAQMQAGQGTSSMQTMNQSLFLLYQRRQISLDTAYENAGELDELRAMVEGRLPASHKPSAWP